MSSTAAVGGLFTVANVGTAASVIGIGLSAASLFGGGNKSSPLLSYPATAPTPTPSGDGEDLATRQRAALMTGDPASASAILTEDQTAAKKSKLGE